MMKKLILTGLLAIASFQAAAETPQVNLVQKIYRDARSSENDTAILNKYADNSLKNALKKVARFEKSGDLCLDFSPIWGGQDYDNKAKISFSQSGNQVRATQRGGASVVYSLSCNGGSCKVTDIKNDGTSLKSHINQSCR